MAGIEFQVVARLLSCREFAEAEGLRMRGGRTVCPFHAGADGYNLAFYGDGRCHCHRCGRTADVVQLAAATWHVGQREAAAELNARFKLGLAGETMTQAERDRRDQARRDEKARREAEREAEAREWASACEAEQSARHAIEQYTEADADKAEFSQALQRLCAAQQRCDMLEAARTGRC